MQSGLGVAIIEGGVQKPKPGDALRLRLPLSHWFVCKQAAGQSQGARDLKWSTVP